MTSIVDNPGYTKQLSKFSCIAAAYFPHVVFAYMVFFLGLAAMISRLVPKLMPFHWWIGRAYIIFMFWCMGTAFLLTNTGLPTAVLMSFVWVGVGITCGWVIINIGQKLMEKKAMQNVTERIASGQIPAAELNVQKLVNMEKGRIAQSKTWAQRAFSWKSFHGAFFFVSWINIAGRIFASNQSGDFTCHTFFVYKNFADRHIPAGMQLQPVPLIDPAYSRLPWAKTGEPLWDVIFSIGCLLIALLFGVVFSLVSVRRAKRRAAVAPSSALVAATNPPAGVAALKQIA